MSCFQDVSVGKPRCTGDDRREACRVPGNRGKDQERMCREQMRTCDLTTEGKPKAPRQSRNLGARPGGNLASKRRAEGTKSKTWASEARPLPISRPQP